MRETNLHTASLWCGGEILNSSGNEVITSISIDSRTCAEKSLFFAIRGEKFNGHNFVRTSLVSGATAAVVDDLNDLEGLPLILVPDTKIALAKFASCCRKCFDIPIIAVTGSVGKTSTKDLISGILSEKYKCLSSKGNYNNLFGLPLSVCELSDQHEIAVFELGMNHTGEISALSTILQPNLGVITNIGLAHIENLGSKKAILNAKLEILKGMNDDGLLILNGDDSFLFGVKDLGVRVFYYGCENSSCDICAKNVVCEGDCTRFEISINGEKEEFFVNLLGEHQVLNCLAAISVGLHYNVPFSMIRHAFERFVSGNMRQNIVYTDYITVFVDCYNSSPDSLAAAIRSFNLFYDSKRTTLTRKVAIIGSMLELGDSSVYEHKRIAMSLFESKFEVLILVGEATLSTKDALMSLSFDNRQVFWFKNSLEAKKCILRIIKRDDVILIKGSRSIKLEVILDEMKRAVFN